MKEKPMYVCKLDWFLFYIVLIWYFKGIEEIESRDLSGPRSFLEASLSLITISSAVIATVDLILLVASVNIAESIVVEEVVESLI